MRTFLKFIFLIFASVVAIYIGVILAVSTLGIFGTGMAIAGAALTFYSLGFRSWLLSQRGYKARLARLPGLGSTSPKKQSIAILLYFIPPSVISWLLLPFDGVDSAITSAVLGSIGLILFYGWFIFGWRLEKKESDPVVPKFSFTDSFTFLRGNKIAVAILTLGIILPIICIGTGIAISAETASTTPPFTGGSERLTTSFDELSDEAEETSSTNEDVVSESVMPKGTYTPISKDTPESTATHTPLPTDTLRPTATKTNTPTPVPQLEVTSGSANLRSGPGVNYQSIGVLESGEVATILARNNDGSWFNVRLDNGTIGWIAASVTQSTRGQTLSTIQVAATIPASPLPEILQPTQPPPTAVPTFTPLPQPTGTPLPINTQPPPTETIAPSVNCDPAYPDVCIPPPPPDLDCGDIPYRRFRVLSPDPHRFDGDGDGIGCES